MKTKLLGITVTAALWLLAIAHAHAFYNPQSGRWLNRDPIEENGGLNLHNFVQENPITVVDSDGLVSFPRIPILPGFPWPHPLPPGTKPPVVLPVLPPWSSLLPPPVQ